MADPYHTFDALERIIDTRMALQAGNTRSKLQSKSDENFDALNVIVKARMRKPEKVDAKPQEHERKSAFGSMKDVNNYFAERDNLKEQEDVLNFDYPCKTQASKQEQEAGLIVQKLQARDKQRYNEAPKLLGYGGQEHSRFRGDHFLSNRDLIKDMDLFKFSPLLELTS